jgi:hypothetical protein
VIGAVPPGIWGPWNLCLCFGTCTDGLSHRAPTMFHHTFRCALPIIVVPGRHSLHTCKCWLFGLPPPPHQLTPHPMATGGEELLPSNILGLDDTPLRAGRAASANTSAAATATGLLASPVPDQPSFASAYSPQRALSGGLGVGGAVRGHTFGHPHHGPSGSSQLSTHSQQAFVAPPIGSFAAGQDQGSLWGAPTSWDASAASVPLSPPPPPPQQIHTHLYYNGGAPPGPDVYAAPPHATTAFSAFGYGSNAFNAPGYGAAGSLGFHSMPLVPTSKPPDWSSSVSTSMGWGAFPSGGAQDQHMPSHSFHQPMGDPPGGVFQSRGTSSPPMQVGRRCGLGRDVEMHLPDNLGLGTSPPLGGAAFHVHQQQNKHIPHPLQPTPSHQPQSAQPLQPVATNQPHPTSGSGGSGAGSTAPAARRGHGRGGASSGPSRRRAGGAGGGGGGGSEAPFPPFASGGAGGGGRRNAADEVPSFGEGSGGRRGTGSGTVSGRGDRRPRHRGAGRGRGDAGKQVAGE